MEIVSGVTIDDVLVVGPYRSLDQLKEGSKVKIEDEEKEKDKGDAAPEEAVSAAPSTADNEDKAEGS